MQPNAPGLDFENSWGFLVRTGLRAENRRAPKTRTETQILRSAKFRIKWGPVFSNFRHRKSYKISTSFTLSRFLISFFNPESMHSKDALFFYFKNQKSFKIMGSFEISHGRIITKMFRIIIIIFLL